MVSCGRAVDCKNSILCPIIWKETHLDSMGNIARQRLQLLSEGDYVILSEIDL